MGMLLPTDDATSGVNGAPSSAAAITATVPSSTTTTVATTTSTVSNPDLQRRLT